VAGGDASTRSLNDGRFFPEYHEEYDKKIHVWQSRLEMVKGIVKLITMMVG
jgi:hypothetical protein